MRISVDPTALQPGDVVITLNDHDLSGCHCDVVVTVDRPEQHCGDTSWQAKVARMPACCRAGSCTHHWPVGQGHPTTRST